MSDLDQKFNGVKTQAYRDYKGLDQLIFHGRDYHVDLNTCIVKLGEWAFEVLPVGTASESGMNPSLILFGKDHPSGISSDKLDEVINQLQLSRHFTAPRDFPFFLGNQGGATACFKQGFKTSALVCQAVQGKAFVSVCPQKETWVWFVILRGHNEATEKFLKVVEAQKLKMTDQNASEWYDQMKF